MDNPLKPKKEETHLFEFKATNSNNVFMVALLLFVLAIELCGAFTSAYDSDIWFILASGRETIASGVPHVNSFSAYDTEMSIIVQQWLYGVLSFASYSVLGMTGLYVNVIVGLVLLFAACFAAVKVLHGTKCGVEVILIVALLCFPGLYLYVNMRPHVFTMAIYAFVVLVCELARRSDNKAWYLVVPVIVVFHANLHMAMALLDPVILYVYVHLDIIGGKPTARRCAVMVLAVIASFLALLANPYGLDGALYVAKSYGYASYETAIIEMAPITLSSGFEVFYVACGVAYAIFLAFCIKADGITSVMRNPLALFSVASFFLGMMHLRNEWMFFLFAFLGFVSMMPKDKGLVFASPFGEFISRSATIVTAVASAVLFFLSFSIYCVGAEPEDSSSMPVNAVEYITAQKDPSQEDVKVSCGFISGAFLEFNGMKVTMDARPEIWQPNISGVDEDFYYDYIDVVVGEDEQAYVDYFEALDCDYALITYESDWMPEDIFEASEKYEKVVEGNDYDLYQKKQENIGG